MLDKFYFLYSWIAWFIFFPFSLSQKNVTNVPCVGPLQASAFPPLQGWLVTTRGEETAGFTTGFATEPLVEKL